MAGVTRIAKITKVAKKMTKKIIGKIAREMVGKVAITLISFSTSTDSIINSKGT